GASRADEGRFSSACGRGNAEDVAVQVTEGDGYCLGRVLINAQIAAPLLWAIHIGCPKNRTHCYRRSGVQLKREATPARTHGNAGRDYTSVGPLFRRRPPSARITSDA